jgi:hypothetical protein
MDREKCLRAVLDVGVEHGDLRLDWSSFYQAGWKANVGIVLLLLVLVPAIGMQLLRRRGRATGAT